VLAFSAVDTLVEFCNGSQATLASKASGGVEPYTWLLSDGTTQPDSLWWEVQAGDWTALLVDANGCDTGFTTTVVERPPVNAGPPDTFWLPLSPTADHLRLLTPAPDTGGIWQGVFVTDSRAGLLDLRLVPDTGSYTIQYQLNSCPADRTVVVLPTLAQLHLPTAFSPNQDGSNDQWVIWVPHHTAFSLVVTNRWGHEVFRSDRMENTWNGLDGNGSAVPEGVYVYQLTTQVVGVGTVTRSGSVTVLR
jgi:gliding motility-associated-like protein